MDYLSDQLVTCIGNKRKILSYIEQMINLVKRKLNKDKLSTFDAFSGSGIVSRLLKNHSYHISTNDLEDYARVVSKCFLSNKSESDHFLDAQVNAMNSVADFSTWESGFIEELYAPKDENDIKDGERVFYTINNAKRIDNYRRMIDDSPSRFFNLLLGVLLSKASIHTNTSGVFKGFHKDRHTGIGKYGGTVGNALRRIRGMIELENPVLSEIECEYEVYQGDTNKIAPKIKGLDLTYLDPPYNQHPYGSNYFMLNLIVNYERPTDISKVSGIPKDWKRSNYNVKSKFLIDFPKLIESLDSKFVLVSFNNEGFVEIDELKDMLNRLGAVRQIEIPYNTYRGSRNLHNRDIYVKEYLFLLEKK